MTVLRKLVTTDEISHRQYMAGVRYAEIARQHDILLGAKGMPRADGEEVASVAYRARYRHAMARYDLCRAALRKAQSKDRNAPSVVDAITINDWSLPDMTPALRIGLNHLADALGLPAAVKVEAEAL